MHKYFVFIFSLFALFSCSTPENGLKVAATPVPHAQMLEFIKPELRAQGIELKIIITEDYNMPNRALNDREIDANFFQHIPFLNAQVEQFHYSIESIAKIEIEPMGIYSKKFHSLAELQDGAMIAVPNDPTNEARALLLLQKNHLIQLDDPGNLQATVLNISHNPKHFRFLEVDPAMLPRTLDDVDAAAINTNYALGAHLSPLHDALALESSDSPYVNVLVVRHGDGARPEIEALRAAMTSEKMRAFILKQYKETVFPAF